MQRISRFSVVVALVTMLLAACTSGSKPASEQQSSTGSPPATQQQPSGQTSQTQPPQGEDLKLKTPKTVKVGANPGAQDFIMWVMMEQKFAEKYNLTIDLVKFANPPATQTALAAKQVDIAFGGLVTTIQARAQGKDTVIFGALTGPSNLMMVKKDSPINSIKDLKGKKIGVFGGTPSTTYQLLAAISQASYGVVMGKDVEIITAPNPALKGLLDKGDLDAVLFGTNDSIVAYLTGNYKIIADLADEFQAKFGRVPAHVVIASTDSYLKDNSDVARAYLAAYLDSMDYVNKNPKVWERYAKDSELTHPDAPKMLQERVAPRFVTKWDDAQLKAQVDVINDLIKIFGSEQIFKEIPAGSFRLDLMPKR